MSYKPYKPNHLELINQKGREPIQPPRLLEHIKKSSIGHCEQLLAHLFSATDDLFYDLSKRASSNNEQNLYFEAMREIRVKREGIANQFLRDVNESFSGLLDSPFEDAFEDDDDGANLSIVEGDDLEVDLARSNMISRARDLFYSELNELSIRLDHLLLQIEIDEDNNPVDPQQLTEIFLAACQTKLTIDIKAKLILFKLFEKHVLKQLGHLYADANQILLDAGIMPKIPKSMDKRAVHGGAQNGDSEQGASGGEAPGDNSGYYQQPSEQFRMGVDALSMLLATARNFAFGGSPQHALHGQPGVTHQGSHMSNAMPPGVFIGGGAPSGYYFYSANPGPVMASPELASLLTQTQPTFDASLAEGQPRNIVTNAVQQVLAEKNPEQPQALEQTDENVINLVAMFFDQILADESLPVAIQSLICRLQIPFLKVALRDHTFFNNPEHPARQLVNTITNVGIGFDETKPIERDPLYKKIVEVVLTINRQYKTDDRIFSELKSELDAFVEREAQKAKTVEQRTRQTEEGKSKIRQAKSVTQQLIYQKLKDVELPEFVHEFLTSHWLQVLVFCYLKHGQESHEWVSHEQTITDLIWISTPHTDVRSVSRRERLFPELLDRIEFGLESAINDPNERKTVVNALETELSKLHTDEDFVETETLKPLSEEHKEALGKGENDPKAWDEMTAVERQQARYEELSSLHFEAAKNMPTGSWFQYFDADSSKTLRCKLASKIDSETYVFVNRLGFKVLDKTRKQFAYDMQFGKAKPLDTNPLFDRIMGKVVSNLADEDSDSTETDPI